MKGIMKENNDIILHLEEEDFNKIENDYHEWFNESFFYDIDEIFADGTFLGWDNNEGACFFYNGYQYGVQWINGMYYCETKEWNDFIHGLSDYVMHKKRIDEFDEWELEDLAEADWFSYGYTEDYIMDYIFDDGTEFHAVVKGE